MTHSSLAFPDQSISRGADRGPDWSFHGAGAAALAGWAILAWWSRRGAAVPLGLVLSVLGLAWAATLVAIRRARAVSLRSICFWALLFRLAALAAVPVLEDDFYRYLWDGRVFATTGDPFGKPPSAWFADGSLPAEAQWILSHINHPDLPTVYGPLCEWAFRLSYSIAPFAIWPWKWMLLAADLACLALLLPRVTPANAVLLAWCPLLLFETGFNAHPESLGVLFLVASAILCERRRPWAAGVALAAAVSVKMTALVLVPLFLLAGGWPAAAAFLIAVSALYLPFPLSGGVGALGVFAQGWEFNASVYSILTALAGSGAGKGLAIAGMASTYGAVLWKRLNLWSAGLLVWGAFFLLAPVVNPWYLLWMLPFAGMALEATVAKRVTIAALAAVSLSYVCGLHLGWPELGAYDHPWWLRPVEYGLLAAAGFWRTRPADFHQNHR